MAMVTTTLSPSEQLRLYRSKHGIEIDPSGDWTTCETDGLKVYSVRGRQWRHDRNQIERLEKAAAREDLDRGVVTFAVPECYRCHRSIPRGSEMDFLAVTVNLGGRLVLKCSYCQDKDVVVESRDEWDLIAELAE